MGNSLRNCFTIVEMISYVNVYQIYENNQFLTPLIHFPSQIEELVNFSNTLKTEGTKIEYGRKLSTRG